MITCSFTDLLHGDYQALSVDPPWEYRSKRTGGSMKSGACQKYPTMSLDELASLPDVSQAVFLFSSAIQGRAVHEAGGIGSSDHKEAEGSEVGHTGGTERRDKCNRPRHDDRGQQIVGSN